MKMASKLSAQQRAVNFAQATRQYKQELPAMNFQEGQTISTSFPKTRFASKCFLRVRGSFKVAHASKTTFGKAVFDKYKLLRQVRIRVNNGFNPYQIGGAELSLYNTMDRFSTPSADPMNTNVLGNVVSVAGTENTVCFTAELPFTLTDKDPIGLVMLQNDQTVVTLEIDCGSVKDVMTDTDITVSDIKIQIVPVLETFSIPQSDDFVPDYSIIKIVNEQIESVTGAGEMIIKLPVGMTYRKMLLYIATDTKFTPADIANLGNFQLVFNQADSPYSISAEHIAYENRKMYAGQLPAGTFAFDFASQGLANLGTGRDYVDTERLTEFWVKINFKQITGATNYVYVVSEKLAKLL
jgi:hypothetical protein